MSEPTATSSNAVFDAEVLRRATYLPAARGFREAIAALWRTNSVRSCARRARRGGSEVHTALDGAKTMARHLGGADSRDAVVQVGRFAFLDQGRDLKELVLHTAPLPERGMCLLVAGEKYGTCWYVAVLGPEALEHGGAASIVRELAAGGQS